MDDFKVERKYLKVCYEFSDLIQMYEKISGALL